MDPSVLSDLRSLLRAPEEGWCSELERLIEPMPAATVVELWLFLHQHLPRASEAHAERMRAMQQQIAARLERGTADPDLLERLAAELDQLRTQAAELDRELGARRQLLAALLGPDQRTRVGAFALRTSAPSYTVKVLDEQAVPASFLASTPDRKAILKHFQETGEIPAGTDINPRRTVVTVTRKG